MDLKKLQSKIPQKIYTHLVEQGITILRPSQVKAIDAGLFSNKNLLICTPTASGKTLVGEMAFLNSFFSSSKKPVAVYLVPLRALASEKYRSFSKKYPQLKITMTSGDMDSDDPYLADYDLIVTTSEKFDSLIRHQASWIKNISCLIVDEIHLLNDSSRGPTLEIILTILQTFSSPVQIIGLSATIGNPEELASWLKAELIIDMWRPVELKKAIFHEDTLYFEEEK